MNTAAPPTDFLVLEPAVFLDFDGTLVGFADDPAAVVVSDSLRRLLESLRAAIGGALAVVSGRQIETLDRLLAPLKLPAAGLHGLERRDASGRCFHDIDAYSDALSPVRAMLHQFSAGRSGVLVEDKGSAVALHYRAAPGYADEIPALTKALLDGPAAHFQIQHGHQVIEVRPPGADKGSAIADFMLEPPFRGRVPLFIGDDRTDEAGFEVVNRLDGLSIKVGEGPSLATTRLVGPDAVNEWLQGGLAGLLRKVNL